MRKPFLPWCLLVVLGWSGCEPLPWHWAYKGLEYPARAPVLNKSVAVMPFANVRLEDNSDYRWLTMIPFVPYAWMDYNRPEERSWHAASSRWKFIPSQDLPQALAWEIDNAHLFRKAAFTADESEGDLVLTGTISSTKYEAKLLCYGLSIACPSSWLLGLPSHAITNDLGLRLSLTDRISGKVLWEAGYSNSERHNLWFWRDAFRTGNDAKYVELLQELMPLILSDLETALKELAR